MSRWSQVIGGLLKQSVRIHTGAEETNCMKGCVCGEKESCFDCKLASSIRLYGIFPNFYSSKCGICKHRSDTYLCGRGYNNDL